MCRHIDPITNLISGSSAREVYSMLLRLIDFLKSSGITALFVSLTGNPANLEVTSAGISSLTDTWILLRHVELEGERNRCLYVLKSRGMAHSNQVREFKMSRRGIRLLPVYVGPGGVLTASSRLAQEARDQAESLRRRQDAQHMTGDLHRKRSALESQISSLELDKRAVEAAAHQVLKREQKREKQLDIDRDDLAKSRGAR